MHETRHTHSWRSSRASAGAAVLATAAALTTTCTPLAASESFNLVQLPRVAASDRTLPLRAAPPRLDHLVVVAIDGVRWQEIFQGMDARLAPAASSDQSPSPAALMPDLHRIAQTAGVLLGGDAARVRVSSPSTVSLPGYSELFSGRTPSCGDNECGQTMEPTLLDEWHEREPNATLALVTSWSRIPRVAARNPGQLLISAGRASPQNLADEMRDPAFNAAIVRGQTTGPAPGSDDYRPDRFTADVGLRLLATRMPEFLFLGLGDTDEHAHQGNYRGYLQALRDADSTIGRIDRWLVSQRRTGKRTLLVVTTDHGRAATFMHHGGVSEAARIWMLFSGDSIDARGTPTLGDSRLADLAATLRPKLGLNADLDPRAGRDLSASLERPTLPSGFAKANLLAAH
jgi:hypothetical protein